MSIKEYSDINCLAQEIEMRQKYGNCPIITRFGSHNVSTGSEHTVNHNTIVLHERTIQHDGLNCIARKQFVGAGKVPLIRLGNTIKKSQTKTIILVKSEKQIEILFN